MSEWLLFEPDYNNKMNIIVFDDGNEHYSKKQNIWYLCGTWKGKVRIINEDRKTYINSISAWKVIQYIQTDNLEDITPQ